MDLRFDLLCAVIQGRESEVRALVASGADVNAVREHNGVGWAPLHHACATFRCGAGIVRFLIEAGADVNERTIYFGSAGQTPLALAIFSRKREIVKVLLAAGAGPHCEQSYFAAISDGYRHILPLLLQHRVPMCVPENEPRGRSAGVPRTRGSDNNTATWAYHDKVVAAGGYDALVKKHRKILASVVDKVVEAKFGRRAPQEVCEHVGEFIAPPGGS